MNPKLSLNLGVRWDPFIPYTDTTDRIACYRPGQKSQRLRQRAGSARCIPAIRRCPAGGYDADWLNLGPRLGLAYDPFGDGSTSVRAGYGVVLRPAEHDRDQQPRPTRARSARS